MKPGCPSKTKDEGEGMKGEIRPFALRPYPLQDLRPNEHVPQRAKEPLRAPVSFGHLVPHTLHPRSLLKDRPNSDIVKANKEVETVREESNAECI